MRLVPLQNYFTFQNTIYQPEKVYPLDHQFPVQQPKYFLQHLEDIHIKQLLDTKSITFYTLYLRDILIVYDTTRAHPDLISTYEYIHQIHTDIKLNTTYKNNRCIRFFDLLIIRKTSNLEIDTYRKPTTTDTTINFLSNHPMEHKVAAFSHNITRMHSLPLIPKKKQKEWKLLQLIAQNNNFPQTLLQRLNLQIQNKQTYQDQIKRRQNLDNFYVLQPNNKKSH